MQLLKKSTIYHRHLHTSHRLSQRKRLASKRENQFAAAVPKQKNLVMNVSSSKAKSILIASN